ncbi:uncharacterized protein RAG0_06619 [Rhynchosporium agropyri]|uniref:N-acetylgalactosaminide beta-1,3-galactosyltransferase n=1 Tax=Rhynchosporium agropyri TaxID=914238 RepID=A0A1E1KI35_9HELO|nr:uncharacterized protein RAG0_06619 [Rhynchosporium agropyri]
MLKFSSRSSGRSLAIRIVVGLAITYLAIIQLRITYSQFSRTQATNESVPLKALKEPLKEPLKEDSNDGNDSDGCGGGLIPFGSSLVLTVKTGATEAFQKIPIQLETTLGCVPLENVLWFSDMAQNIGGHLLIDALDQIPASVKNSNSDFDLYTKQQELKDPVEISKLLKNMKSPEDDKQLAAWALDKYKNLHIVEKAFAAKPDADWYMHIDADTYVLWPSLVAWIKKLDPSKKYYLGSMACLDTLPFAHGGSGILVSRAATRSLVVDGNGTAARWDSQIAGNCCGDGILAAAFKEQDIHVKNANPSLMGESPSTIKFELYNWHEPLVTLHHVSAIDAVRLRSFEDKRQNKSAPVLYSELFTGLIWDMIPDSAEDWDNLSDGATVPNIYFADECARACKMDVHCLQSRFDGEICQLTKDKVSLGEKKYLGGDGKKWHSTWNKKRISAWVAKQKKNGVVKFPYEDGKTSKSSHHRCSGEVQAAPHLRSQKYSTLLSYLLNELSFQYQQKPHVEAMEWLASLDTETIEPLLLISYTSSFAVGEELKALLISLHDLLTKAATNNKSRPHLYACIGPVASSAQWQEVPQVTFRNTPVEKNKDQDHVFQDDEEGHWFMTRHEGMILHRSEGEITEELDPSFVLESLLDINNLGLKEFLSEAPTMKVKKDELRDC